MIRQPPGIESFDSHSDPLRELRPWVSLVQTAMPTSWLWMSLKLGRFAGSTDRHREMRAFTAACSGSVLGVGRSRPSMNPRAIPSKFCIGSLSNYSMNPSSSQRLSPRMISFSIKPKLHTSCDPCTSVPDLIASGAAYSGVPPKPVAPTTRDREEPPASPSLPPAGPPSRIVLVIATFVLIRDKPKSATKGRYVPSFSSLTSTLAGFKSRCTICFACRARSPSAIPVPKPSFYLVDISSTTSSPSSLSSELSASSDTRARNPPSLTYP